MWNRCGLLSFSSGVTVYDKSITVRVIIGVLKLAAEDKNYVGLYNILIGANGWMDIPQEAPNSIIVLYDTSAN